MNGSKRFNRFEFNYKTVCHEKIKPSIAYGYPFVGQAELVLSEVRDFSDVQFATKGFFIDTFKISRTNDLVNLNCRANHLSSQRVEL